MAGITIWQIWQRMGVAVWGFIGCIFVFFFVMYTVASRIGFYREKISAQTDARCSATEELVGAMKDGFKTRLVFIMCRVLPNSFW